MFYLFRSITRNNSTFTEFRTSTGNGSSVIISEIIQEVVVPPVQIAENVEVFGFGEEVKNAIGGVRESAIVRIMCTIVYRYKTEWFLERDCIELSSRSADVM
jgi:hypothetical protein